MALDLQLLYAKFDQNPFLIVPACLLTVLLLKVFIFLAKISFMPCGVNVRPISNKGHLAYLIVFKVEKVSRDESFIRNWKENYKYIQLGR